MLTLERTMPRKAPAGTQAGASAAPCNRQSRRRNLRLCCVLAATILPLALCAAQIGNNPPIPPSWSQSPGQSPLPTSRPSAHTEDPAERMRREQVERLAITRQEKAKVEAAELLELATKLKAEVDSAGSATISAESAKAPATADAIAKLAKSIKSKTRPI